MAFLGSGSEWTMASGKRQCLREVSVGNPDESHKVMRSSSLRSAVENVPTRNTLRQMANHTTSTPTMLILRHG